MTDPILITGATSGLGQRTAIELAERGHHVILGHRDETRAESIRATITRRAPAAQVSTLHLDLADLTSITHATRRLHDGPRLSGIICNAAVQIVTGVATSTDGYELTFATNHLGHFHLVTGLTDHLTHPARILVISSGTHLGPKESLGFPAPDWQDATVLADPTRADDTPTAGRVRYATSKLANILFTYELARRGVTANAFDPGLMPRTALSRDYPPPLRLAYRLLAPLATALIPAARTPATSARHCADLMTERRWHGTTGSYIVDDRPHESAPETYDTDLARRLWDQSEQLIRQALARRHVTHT